MESSPCVIFLLIFLGNGDELGKRLLIVHGKIGKHLAVDLDAGLRQ